jgi:hypothetical protein
MSFLLDLLFFYKEIIPKLTFVFYRIFSFASTGNSYFRLLPSEAVIVLMTAGCHSNVSLLLTSRDEVAA